MTFILPTKLSSQATAIHSVDGQIISDRVGVREHRAEYFEQLCQVDPPIVILDASGVEIPVQDLPIREDQLTQAEVIEAFSKLRVGIAVGI